MSVRKVVVGVIYRKDKNESTAAGRQSTLFLVMHRVLGWKGWEFPKGGVERKDNWEDEIALKREIREETGLSNIRIIDKLPFIIKYRYPKRYASKYRHTSTHQHVYLVRAFDEEVTTEDEHDGYKWLPYREARRTLKWPSQKKALDAAMKYLDKEGKGETVVTH